MPPIMWGAEHQEIEGSSPDHFSPTGREEEVGWPHETTVVECGTAVSANFAKVCAMHVPESSLC